MEVGRADATATLLDDGRVLIAGGYRIDDNGATIALAWAELYDPSSGTFAATGSLHEARYRHTATLLDNGGVLLVGGTGVTGALASAELYEPDSGSFVMSGSMATARVGHTATALAAGWILVAGGDHAMQPGTPEYLASAEVYNSNDGRFRATGSMASARFLAVAVRLADGRVLVAGGTRTEGDRKVGVASAELYDPEAGVFVATGSMSTGRAGAVIALLPGGGVLVAGGQNLGGASELPASAEIFDPTTGLFTPAGSLMTPRVGATATRLPDGRFLIAGGASRDGVLASAELYQSQLEAGPTARPSGLGRLTVGPIRL
jgi:hypothetical protein